jgi:EAL domain-containing protein (putative c-di-GMP-specific phosphodiesterase class I)
VPLLRAGIDGYVVKGSPPERLVEAINAALAGDGYLAPRVNRFAMAQLSNRLLAEEQVAMRSMRLRQKINGTIAQSSFKVVFQPIIDCHRDTAVAAEALTRFPERGRTTPQWLADAESVGLLVPLELALAATALLELPNLDPSVAMAVNVSPTTVVSGRLHEVLTGVPVDRVILEITEHAPVDDYKSVRTALSRWRDKGMRIAVDDAGGGYSSFAHILELSPELIKLDTSLIRDLHTSPHRQALVRAVISFAEEMHVQVVAEGVEAEAELIELRRLGAHFAQGFHLGRPRGLDEQTELTLTSTGTPGRPRTSRTPDLSGTPRSLARSARSARRCRSRAGPGTPPAPRRRPAPGSARSARPRWRPHRCSARRRDPSPMPPTAG